MNKLELFIAACKEERWRWRMWRISLFAVTALPENNKSVKYDIDYRPDGTYYYDGDAWEKVQGDIPPETPLYKPAELVKFPEHSVPNHHGAIETTYGRMLYNWMVICYAFDDKIPFQEKTMPSGIVKMFAEYLVDEVDDEGKPLTIDYSADRRKFYPSEVGRFVQAVYELGSLCPYVTPTGSVKSLTTHPEMIKTRNSLLAKYKDQLDDPAVVTMIQNELVELDKEWLKGDNAEGYYISGKSYSVKRKKLFVMHGIEAAFRDDSGYELLETSLAEGWEMDKLVAKYNAIREGSFDRGHDTALGGEKVTFLQRIFQNIQVLPGDCGTKLTHRRHVDEKDLELYSGLNLVDNGKLVPIVGDNIKKYANSVVSIRRPILCRLPLTDFCAACAGEALASSPRAAAALIADVGSVIMYAFMSAMHGNELAVSHYDFKRHLT